MPPIPAQLTSPEQPAVASQRSTSETHRVNERQAARTPAKTTVDGKHEPPAPTVLRGTFAAIDEHGIEHPTEDGRLTFTTQTVDGSHTYEATAVAAGQWTANLECEPTSMTVVAAWLGGKPVRCQQHVSVLDPHGVIELRGQWLPRQTLNVVDAGSNAHLASVRIVTSDLQDEIELGEHPGDASLGLATQNTVSPIRFTPKRISRDHTYWISAPGYAWRALRIDTTHAATQEVRLHRGGSLLVDASDVPEGVRNRPGGLPGQNIGWARIRVSVANGETVLTNLRAEPGHHTEVEGLPIGPCQVELVAPGQGSTTVLARSSAIVAAGSTTRVSLEPIADFGGLGRTRIDGTLQLPEEWGRDIRLDLYPVVRTPGSTYTMRHQSLGTMRRVGSNTYEWRLDLVAGKYTAFVTGTGYWQRVSLPTPGEPVAIAVPPPASVSLLVVDEVDGRPIEHDDWKPDWRWNPDATTRQYSRMEAADETTFACMAPPGTIAVGASPDGYFAASQRFVVRPGSNHLTLPLRRAFGIEIQLHDGNRQMPWPSRLTARLLDAQGNEATVQARGNRIAVNPPGTYTLALGHVASCEPIPKRAVQITARQWTQVRVRVNRMR